MLIAATLVLLLQLACVAHVIRTGRNYRWISAIVFLPVVGCAMYWVSQVLPTRKRDAARRRVSRLLGTLADRHDGPGAEPRTRMRIVFIDPSLAYTVQTPYDEPLGGAASACCYLAEALAAAGHEVVLLTLTQAVGAYRGVLCAGWEDAPAQVLRALRPDAVIMMLSARYGRELRRVFGDETRLILFAQHAHDQPAMQPLQDPAERDVYDGIAMVSDWQRDQCVQAFELDPARVCVLGNAIAPAFRDLFGPGEAVHGAKVRPPVLAYTSPPYRGLRVLLELFPRIRRRFPGTRLKVFSSMRVYQIAGAQDDAEYGDLYRLCRETEGVEYVGSISQPALAAELRGVTALTYPDTIPETFCIAALEAMAAGCRVVSSVLGAMPQTTAGFGRLVPIIGRSDTYADEYTEATVAALEESLGGADADLIARQVAYVNTECTWTRRAEQWTEWLGTMPRVRADSADSAESDKALER